LHFHFKRCQLDCDPIGYVYVFPSPSRVRTYGYVFDPSIGMGNGCRALYLGIADDFRPHEVRVAGKRPDQRQERCSHAGAARFFLNDLIDASPLLVGPWHLRVVCRHVSPLGYIG
jgi:hypothetical protein